MSRSRTAQRFPAVAATIALLVVVRELIQYHVHGVPSWAAPSPEETVWHQAGHALASQGQRPPLAFMPGPVYVFFLAGIYRFAGESLPRVRFFQGLATLVVLWLFVRTMRATIGTGAAASAALIWGLCGTLLAHECQLSPAWLLAASTGLALTLAAVATPSPRRLALSGFFLGFAVATWPPMIVAAATLAWALRAPRVGRAALVASSLVVPLTVALLCSPGVGVAPHRLTLDPGGPLAALTAPGRQPLPDAATPFRYLPGARVVFLLGLLGLPLVRSGAPAAREALALVLGLAVAFVLVPPTGAARVALVPPLALLGGLGAARLLGPKETAGPTVTAPRSTT
ncbi:MAG: glycosyltransferase family 39 protein [Candidatus Riflebacteria bacterium]|nr:glycosyltransferase family 39 protein [Candidatus Riflebacteria bacterium]